MDVKLAFYLHLSFLALTALLGPFTVVVPTDIQPYVTAAMTATAALAALFANPNKLTLTEK